MLHYQISLVLTVNSTAPAQSLRLTFDGSSARRTRSLVSWVRVDLAVSTGSVLCPILYILFIADIASVFAMVGTTGRVYSV